mmetsp:Transcript_60661/g.112526  ORF Transcript_60661/g.112526 Transcript_60661/m.112526 type:complete len:425 (-) Transcript_60661:68-1342(-)
MGASSTKSPDELSTRSSIVIIGMRGAGKTTLGAAAAAALGWQFVDLDQHFEAHIGRSIATFVAEEGWPAFRKAELDTLQSVLASKPQDTVVACGGGIVETQAAVEVLESWYPVVHVQKPLVDVEKALSSDSNRAKLPEPLSVVFERRAPLYRRCSNYDFYLCPGDEDWQASSKDFAALAERIVGRSKPVRYDEDSFFLSLTFPEVAPVTSLLPKIEVGIDALELRADLLQSQAPDSVARELATLRRASALPVVFTVRSKAQGGKFAASEKEVAELLSVGLRCACEFVDVEAALSTSTIDSLLASRRVSRLIGSHHDMARMPPLSECRDWLHRCTLDGRATLSKLVVGAERPEDCVALQGTALAAELPIPFIAINAGVTGQMSRILNRTFTPVTHPDLPVAAAPGQLSAAYIMEVRRALGYCQAE